ncbi:MULTISPECIES: hypothetical protein [Acinetobacter calcoaceticus/baumannii complex]|uniref:Uncharacterized protein n=1 Tax=Acinetobacter nosocomialis TaxID=106654 RepID=A0A836MN01_ACINO|nr:MULTISPECIES: hypothetical protein [Acinetobacter calcoaceticus/baumannii complex]EXH73947.1 hypothetical protein J633_3869 [Acinetobacter sp. 216872]KDM58213.1 hypothetical protein AE32_00207 [Acinetobacter nosocomialis]MBU3118413.1 hypothetical protein [Acinetobacter nosocomialis]PRV97516.1 hypothetical protein CSB87_2006 [Acinetobacter sp. AR_0276]
MNNHSNEENTDNSSDKKSPAFKVLESNAEKFLMVWWYGALAKTDRRTIQPKVHVAFRELLEDNTPTDNFIFINANITDLVSWPIGTVWHHERLVKYIPLEIREFDIDHTDFKHTYVQTYKRDEKTGKIDHFFSDRNKFYINPGQRENCISFSLKDQEYKELLVPCFEFLVRGYGISTELPRILTTYDEAERHERLYTPHPEEENIWTILIGDSLTLDDHVFIAYYKYSEYTQDAVRILFSSIAKHDDFTQRNHIYPKVMPWHEETRKIRVSGFCLPDTNAFLALTILGMELPDQTHIRRVPKVIHRVKKPVDVNSPNPPQLQLGPGQINVSEDQGGRKPLSQSVILGHEFTWLGSGPIGEKSKTKYERTITQPQRKKNTKETNTIGTGEPDSSKDVLNSQIKPTTDEDKATEFEAPDHGRIMGLWNACLKAHRLNPCIVNAVHYYTFEEEFDYNDKPTLMAFITGSEEQAHINWCYADSFKTALRGALVIRLSLVGCPPVYIFDIQPATYVSTVEGESVLKERGHAGVIFRSRTLEQFEQYISDLMESLPLSEGSYTTTLLGSNMVTQLFVFRHSNSTGLSEGESTLLNALRKIGIININLKEEP